MRGLHREGVPVYALDSTLMVGSASKVIRHMFTAPVLDAGALPGVLRDIRSSIPFDQVVLFATNDNHVRALASSHDQVADQYLLSWAGQGAAMLQLQQKEELEPVTLQQGLLYPKSAVINSDADLAAVGAFGYPLILKPARPLSSFKTALAHTPAELADVIARYQADLPIVVQEYIAGDDTSLYFGALVLDRGRTVQGMVGRKLASFPPARGQTTIAETVEEPEVLRLTEQFFEGFHLSGPVSLELKKGPDGRYWVIEPTVGRTDFWSELCIAAGFNQPYLEFRIALGQPLPAPKPLQPVAWYDCERIPLAYWEQVRRQRTLRPYGKPAYFTFWRRGDMAPFWRACRALLSARVQARLQGGEGPESKLFPLDQPMPSDLTDWLAAHAPHGVFATPDWFRSLASFERSIRPRQQSARFGWLVVFERGAPTVAAPVEVLRGRAGRCEVRLLSNYYTPRIDLLFDQDRLSHRDAWRQLLRACHRNFGAWLALGVEPQQGPEADDLQAAAAELGLHSTRYLVSANYFADVEDIGRYWANRPSQLRNTLRRKGRVLERAQHRFEITSTPSPEQIAAYWQSYHKSWKHREPSPAFINWLIEWGAAHGRVRLGLLYLGERVAASQLWLVDGERAYIFKLAQDRDTDRHSPGSLLTERMIRHVREVDNVKVVDFLLGTDTYKQMWMDQSTPVYGVEIVNNRTLAGKTLLAYYAVRNRVGRRTGAAGDAATAPQAVARA